jgi:hypothetical protein
MLIGLFAFYRLARGACPTRPRADYVKGQLAARRRGVEMFRQGAELHAPRGAGEKPAEE